LQYFPDLGYAHKVVTEMFRVVAPGGRVIILDVNDQEKKAEFETVRRGNLGAEEYERRYANLAHLYYRRDWFENLGHPGMDIEIFDRVIKGYGNSQYRFNVIFTKPGADPGTRLTGRRRRGS
jgi:SAM-dependent methyltransferase